jgi:hypothetical protein
VEIIARDKLVELFFIFSMIGFVELCLLRAEKKSHHAGAWRKHRLTVPA